MSGEPAAPPSDPAASTLASNRRSMRWSIGAGAAAIAGLGLVLLFLLTQATNNTALYEQNYQRLFVLNVAVAVLLLLVIVWIVWRLMSRLRRGKFGSRLLVKLSMIFALVGFLPGVLIYVVSYQFVSRSIESWFDVKVEGALDAGLNLGRSTLDTMASTLAGKSQAAALQLSDAPDAAAGLRLERVREQLGASDAFLWSSNGQLIASVGEARFQLQPDRPTPTKLRAVRSQKAITQIEGLDDLNAAGVPLAVARIKAFVLVPAANFGLNAEPRILQVVQPLPSALVSNAIAVQEAYREYQERALARGGLRRMYIGTLTLSLFLAVFGAIVLAVLLGNQLARPLLLLAEGVRQVAAGDLTPKAALQTRDELGGLTRSFAVMTQQLADARGAVNQSMEQVNAARANLQTILDNLTAGVIVLDATGHVLSSNPGATRVLRAPLAANEGRLLASIPGLEDFGAAVQQQFEELHGERSLHGLDHWQDAFELHTGDSQDVTSIVARGAELPAGEHLLVFDDISEIVSAQRAQAWAEVARRLAHEIKNPLTPIQLSAERLEARLNGKVGPTEQAILTKSVKTIVDQVDAMKRLVNEFRDYARLPAAELQPVDLNALLGDLLHLYSPENALVPVRCELDRECPPILGDAQQLRQLVHNLVQNAQDASHGSPNAEVLIKTQWVSASGRVRLSVRDNGPGFAENILKRAFEPYVTTKPRGTGLGLAVVKKIADDHRARIAISNRVVGDAVQGAQVSLSFAVAQAQHSPGAPDSLFPA